MASQVHLVRHGEVANPDGVLYGRLPDFALSERGARMAALAADHLRDRGAIVRAVVASPLQRTLESAAPVAAAYGLTVSEDERLIEPSNHFEGLRVRRAVRNPAHWPWLVNPLRPSWGEAYRSIAARMRAAVRDAFAQAAGGDVVLVSHQLPIWITHLALAGKPYPHNPQARRCALSSVTTLSLAVDGTIFESHYADPAARLAADAVDVGAA